MSWWQLIFIPGNYFLKATTKKVITREEWEKKLNDVKIRKEDMNKLVMNFLVTEGYVEAAEKFRTESGTERILFLVYLFVSFCVCEWKRSCSLWRYVCPYWSTADIDLATITDRMAVKKAVQNGNVEDAIEKVNDLNPEVGFPSLIYLFYNNFQFLWIIGSLYL